MEDVKLWTYGSKDGGMERARGVLEKASDTAVVQVFAIEERQIAMFTRRGKPE